MADSSYFIAWQMTNNYDLRMRVAASAQQEADASGTPLDDPEQWSQERRWTWATQTNWIAAVQSALDVGITEWGRQPGVITDQMILSYVQPALAQEP